MDEYEKDQKNREGVKEESGESQECSSEKVQQI